MKSHGFTLLELSISLVIIGLLAGGIMIGRHLIHVAEVRAQIAQIQDYQTAYNTFRNKYNCIPGDCARGADFFPGVTNGNGNGLIQNVFQSCYDAQATRDDLTPATFTTNMAENYYAYQELLLAGLIKNKTTLIYGSAGLPSPSLDPKSAFLISGNETFGSNVITRNPNLDSYKFGNNLMWFVVCAPQSGTAQGWDDDCAIFTGVDLKSIDQKIDDGRPLTGRSMGFGGHDNPSVNGVNNDCLLTDLSDYNLQNTTKQCQAVFQLD